MKSSLATLFLSSLAFVGVSQITITQADMPNVNDTVRLSTTLDLLSVDPSITGANQNWDFSTLTNVDQNVTEFSSVTSTPIAYQFFFNNAIFYPNYVANYAIPGTDFDAAGLLTVTNVFDFFKKSASHYQQVGFGAEINGLPSSVRYDDIDNILQFPLNYGNNDSDTYFFELDVPATLYYSSDGTRENIVDGWGTLTVPMGTYDVLRVKSTINSVDSVNISLTGFGFTIPRPERVEYKWYSAGSKIPMLQVNESAGLVTGITYQDINREVGLDEWNNTRISIYPNPTQDQLSIEIDKIQQSIHANLFNVDGKLVKNFTVNDLLTTINLEKLEPGLYVLKIGPSEFKVVKQ